MQDMYRENILDHGKNPRNRGVLEPSDIDVEMTNPLCGDRLRLTLKLDADRRIKQIGWDGEGCAISQAAASMLGEEMLGKTIDEVAQFEKQMVFDMIGIPLGINRVKCALLSLKVLKVGLFKLDGHTYFDEDEDD